MATTRTDGTDASKNVREQMLAEKRRRANQPRPSTAVSDDAAVQGSKAQGGPNPNDQGLPVRFSATLEVPEADEVTEEAPEAPEQVSEAPESNDEELERPNGLFGGQGEWYAYRLANGYTADELVDDDGEQLGRNALRDLDDR